MKKFIIAALFMLAGLWFLGLFVMPIISKIIDSPLDSVVNLVLMIILLFVVMNVMKIGKTHHKRRRGCYGASEPRTTTTISHYPGALTNSLPWFCKQ